MLDVGAVAQRLLTLRPLCGGDTGPMLAFLVALHDLGKISASFRTMLRERCPQTWRHWEHSVVLLRCHDRLLEEILGGAEMVRETLYEALAGHHGGPRERQVTSYQQQQMREIGSESLEYAEQAIHAIASLFPGV